MGKKGKKGKKQDDDDLWAHVPVAGQEPDDAAVVPEVKEDPPAAGGAKKGKKGKKGKKDDFDWDTVDPEDAIKASLPEPEPEEEPTPAANNKKAAKKGKKGKGGKKDDDFDWDKADPDELVAAAAPPPVDEPEPEPTPAANNKKGKKGKKGKGKKDDDFDWDKADPDQLVADAAVPEAEPVPEPEPEPTPAANNKKGKKGKKGKGGKKDDDFDWDKADPDELVAEAVVPEAEPEATPAPEPAGKKGKKGGKKGKGKKDDFDWDTVDPEEAVAASMPEPEPVVEAPKGGKKGKQDKKKDPPKTDIVPPKEEKKEEKTETPTAETPTVDTPTGDKDEDEDEKEGKDKKKKKKKKGKKEEEPKKKPSKIAALILKQKEEEEARIAALNEKIRLEEERLRKEEEEERLREEEAAAKKAAAKERKLQKRKELGKPLTAKEREKKAADEAFKQEMIAKGMIAAAADDNEEGPKKKKVVYGKKKKGPQKKDADVEEDAKQKAEEDAKKKKAEEDAKMKAEARKKKEEEAKEEAVVESWEDATPVVTEQVEPVKTAWDATSSEEASGSGSGSGAKEVEVVEEEVKVKKKGGDKEKDKVAEDLDDVDGTLRSPICCILGHVDTGKTKLLDKIRRTNVQGGEAGGITQQIGATFFPKEAIEMQTDLMQAKNNKVNIPGLLIIDTPGHESFTNLRSRGSSLCDIAILVVDIMHALEPQTIESLNLLRQRKTPFVVALNKIDRCFGWKPITSSSKPYAPFAPALAAQGADTVSDFHKRVAEVTLALNELGFNVKLHQENKDFRKYVSLVPTSAHSGEGIPDLLFMLVQLTQRMMEARITLSRVTKVSVLEVKIVEGLGTTIDCVVVDGVIHEGATIVVCGMDGPIVTTIRALLTPHPMKELRVKTPYMRHKVVKAAQGIKISANDLDKAVAGTQLLVYRDGDDLDDMKDEVMKDMKDMFTDVDKSGLGVYVKASTLGSLEALLCFLKDSKIPVANIGLGSVHKKDVVRASTMLERKPDYAVILAFDVTITAEATALANKEGVRIFPAMIIYHLFDQFTAYIDELKAKKKEEARSVAIFPAVFTIVPNSIFNKKAPIILGVEIQQGMLKVGAPICVSTKDKLVLGRVSTIELNHVQCEAATEGQQVAIKIDGPDNIMAGRHFDETDTFCTVMTRQSIDLLKEHFRDEMSKEWWKLIIKKFKPLFNIP